MKIRDLLEGRTGSLQDDVADALPATYVFPKLLNTDPYTQYRYGVAIAAARRMSRNTEHERVTRDDEFAPQTPWGENLVVVTYNPEDEKVLDMAAKLVGTPKRQITSTRSEETPDVDTQSPIKPIK